MQTLIDDSSVTLGTIMASRFVGALRAEVEKMESNIKMMQARPITPARVFTLPYPPHTVPRTHVMAACFATNTTPALICLVGPLCVTPRASHNMQRL